MTGKSLHQLAESNKTDELRAVLSESVESINTYATYPVFRTVIYRHGLKGTPLHVAVISNCVEAARLLLEFGADQTLNVMQFERGYDEVPQTAALDLAKRLKLREMIEMLNDTKD
jgi:hypothetical protein